MANNTVDNRIKEVSSALDIPYKVAREAYYSSWKFIKNKMATYPLKDELTEEEFKQLRTSFNVPSIGKLACTYDKYKLMHGYYKKSHNDTDNKES